ncbi:TNF receptor-associated factor 6-A isoform X2 [Jatropha curcas]|uniref:TNF receptor-associated factor 6-A isoform X2 n=1 Tax=Jatropha curcas TaxID=180498 RepID=UPI001893D10C|nr:TNF receptor-associated factor 6-A isoform X2 [Jatropha curcas]
MDSWALNCLEGNLTNAQSRGYTHSQQVQVQAQAQAHGHQTTNVVEVLDDEVTIISPRAFAEARQNSERNSPHGILRGCADATTLCNNCKRRIPDDSQPCLKPGTSNRKKAKNVSTVQESSQSVPVPEESIFSCPICIGPLIEPTSTKCGHIFCKECLLRSLKSLRSKCPTCRQKVGKRSIFRVYLPTTIE